MYFIITRASEGTLSQSRLHLQSLAPTPVSRSVDVRPVVKIIAESLSQHDKKHVVSHSLADDEGQETLQDEVPGAHLLSAVPVPGLVRGVQLLQPACSRHVVTHACH
jgi:molybdopterin-guanine dinucleotide biosynthesis protein A